MLRLRMAHCGTLQAAMHAERLTAAAAQWLRCNPMGLRAKQPAYPSFGTRLDDVTGAVAEVGFASIRCGIERLKFASTVEWRNC